MVVRVAEKGKAIEKVPCQFCGIPTGNPAVHEKACEKNPVNMQKPAEDKPSAPSIKFSSVQDVVDDGLRAWFNTPDNKRLSRIPLKCAIITDNKTGEEVATVLVMSADGTLLPPFMITGFLGMFPDNIEFSETTEQQAKEPIPEEPIYKTADEVLAAAKQGK